MNHTISIHAKKSFVKYFAFFSILFLAVDFTYSQINNISYANREECILNKLLPKPAFLFMEYFVELTMLVFIGIFIATLLEKFFTKYKKLYPSNLLTAFAYASILPVCACSVIPLIHSLKGKLPFRNIIAFVVSAPLLSPYIIMLSLSVISVEYTILRIISAFILAASAGLLLDFCHRRLNIETNMASGPVLLPIVGCESPGGFVDIMSGPSNCSGCGSSQQTACAAEGGDVFLKTYIIFMDVLPYIIFAGIAGILLEYVPLNRLLLDYDIDNKLISIVLVVLIGVPIYFCSGAEVLFLRPLMHTADFSMGTAIAFSLSSTAICITSAIMLIKFLGKRLTAILIIHIFITTIIIGWLINTFYKV